jgi:hypothetical protein
MARRLTRTEARTKIVQAANRRRVRTGSVGVNGWYDMRHLQRCVAVCRNLGLVKPDVLTAAGFNVHGPNYRTPRPKD